MSRQVESTAMMEIESVDHIQLPVPSGGLPSARAFYEGLLGLSEVQDPGLEQPGTLRFALGWQRLDLSEGDYTGVAPQAHLALRVQQVRAVGLRLALAWQRVDFAPLPDGTPRLYVEDPFGNRLELVENPAPALPAANARHASQFRLAV